MDVVKASSVVRLLQKSSSPEKVLEAYARLRTADKLTVQINRGGKNMNLDDNIR